MKSKLIMLTLTMSLLLVCVSFGARAEIGQEQQPGWFVGPTLVGGYEFNELAAFGGGGGLNFGYHFNEYVSLGLQTGGYYTSDSGVNLLFVNAMPFLRYNVYQTLYLYAGANYTWLHSSGGFAAGGLNFATSANKHGFGGEVGLGYDFYVTDTFSIAPQLGFNYTYIASSHLMTPTLGVNFNFHF